jgi:hypothetical protein
MKKTLLLITAIFALALPTMAQNWIIGSSPSPAPASNGTNFNADLWFDAEFDAAAGAATTAQLEASDHFAPTGITSISDTTSLLSTSSSGQQTCINKPQSTADTGTRGMAINMNMGSAFPFWQWAPASMGSTISVACWIKNVPAVTSGNDIYFAELLDSIGNNCIQFRVRNSGGTLQALIWVGGSSTTVTITAGQSYCFNAIFTTSATCKGMVINSSGAAMTLDTGGTTFTTTDTGAFTPHHFRLGAPDRTGTQVATFCVDNFMAKWTGTPQFPLGM